MGETSLPLAVTRWPCWTSVRGLLELEQASLFFTIYLVCDILLAALTVFNHANNDIGEAYSNLLMNTFGTPKCGEIFSQSMLAHIPTCIREFLGDHV